MGRKNIHTYKIIKTVTLSPYIHTWAGGNIHTYIHGQGEHTHIHTRAGGNIHTYIHGQGEIYIHTHRGRKIYIHTENILTKNVFRFHKIH